MSHDFVLCFYEPTFTFTRLQNALFKSGMSKVLEEVPDSNMKKKDMWEVLA